MKHKLIVLLIIAPMLYGCDALFLGDEEHPVSVEENQAIPALLDDGWDVSSPEAELVNGDQIRYLIRSLHRETKNIHSIVIVKNNKLVVEAYFGGWHRDRRQSIRSCSKSVTSALIGIAIDQHHLEDVEQKVFDFFPNHQDLRTPEKDEILLKHVLMMASGLQWNQTTIPDDDPRNDEVQLGESADGFRYVLEKKRVAAPGVVFNYSSGNSDLLPGVLYHTTGKHADVFGDEFLFKPLGITNYGWRKCINGFPNAGYGIVLRPRDMAKFGQLFLDSGVWKGQRIISSQWIKESTKKSIAIPQDNTAGYGYQWWVREWSINGTTVKTFQAQGNGGQIISVVPQFNAVVILTGANYGTAGQLAYNILSGVILPAIVEE